jgi:hypothetical protein
MHGRDPDCNSGCRRCAAESNLGFSKIQAQGRNAGDVGDVPGGRAQAHLGTQL